MVDEISDNVLEVLNQHLHEFLKSHFDVEEIYNTWTGGERTASSGFMIKYKTCDFRLTIIFSYNDYCLIMSESSRFSRAKIDIFKNGFGFYFADHSGEYNGLNKINICRMFDGLLDRREMEYQEIVNSLKMDYLYRQQ